jgi:hypothetical protein
MENILAQVRYLCKPLIEPNDSQLLCARNTWSVYKVERKSEDDLWSLGGKKSDFEMAPGPPGRLRDGDVGAPPGPYLAVRARDRSGRVLGTSVPVKL